MLGWLASRLNYIVSGEIEKRVGRTIKKDHVLRGVEGDVQIDKKFCICP